MAPDDARSLRDHLGSSNLSADLRISVQEDPDLPPQYGTLSECGAGAGQGPKRMVSERRRHMESPHGSAQS